MEHDKSKRFLDAFHQIEQQLRKLTQMASSTPFVQLLNKAAILSKPVKFHYDELKSLGELRNAIVHRRRGNEAIAEPHLDIVEQTEKIRDQVLKPPVISNQFLVGVKTCSLQDPVGHVIKEMFEASYSQIPIYEDGRFRGLLTTDAIARWLAARLEAGGLVEEEMVEDVLPYSESKDNVKLVGRNETLFDIIHYFNQANFEGKRLDALIVSNSGRSSEKPLGIITVFDLPKIFGEVKVLVS